MKTFLIVAAFVLLGVGPALADENCMDITEVAQYVKNNTIGVEVTDAPITIGEHTYVGFSSPGTDRVLIVDFVNDCMGEGITVSREDFDAWLAGKRDER